MTLRLATFVALLSFSLFSWAVDVQGTIRWNEICPEIARLGQAKVVLDNGVYAGRVTRDGSFLIPDISPGTYILSVVAHDFTFDNVRIDVANSTATPEARPYIAGTPHNPPGQVQLPVPLVLTPRQKHVYFAPPGSFNLLSMFSNPMMLFAAVAACLVVGLPYVIKNLDPETLREIKERQEKMQADQHVPPSDMSVSTRSRTEGSQKPANVVQGKATSGKKSNKRK